MTVGGVTVCVCWECSGVKEKIPNLARASFLSRLCMRRPVVARPVRVDAYMRVTRVSV